MERERVSEERERERWKEAKGGEERDKTQDPPQDLGGGPKKKSWIFSIIYLHIQVCTVPTFFLVYRYRVISNP